MSHQIEENDLTASMTSAEWHGLAYVPETQEEMKEIAEGLDFPILECDAVITLPETEKHGSETIALQDEDGKGWKVLAADCRDLPKHSGRSVHPPAIVPMHVPKTSYKPIPNGRVLDAMKASFKEAGIDYEIATVGTLANLARFYVSIDVGEALKITCPKGFDINTYLTFTTSHAGEGFRVYDSQMKPVCANTLDGGIARAGEINMNVRHTKNAEFEILEIEKTLAQFMAGADEMTTLYGEWQEIAMNEDQMFEAALGYYLEGNLYLANLAPDSERGLELIEKIKGAIPTTNSLNAARGITKLASDGEGNDGDTMYDLFNGMTDYYSNGAGSGSARVGIAKRVFRSRFGKAAEHKRDFTDYLSDPKRVALGRVLAAAAVRNG